MHADTVLLVLDASTVVVTANAAPPSNRLTPADAAPIATRRLRLVMSRDR
jgi:hypothetical protein